MKTYLFKTSKNSNERIILVSVLTLSLVTIGGLLILKRIKAK
jgi:hypothetical protein